MSVDPFASSLTAKAQASQHRALGARDAAEVRRAPPPQGIAQMFNSAHHQCPHGIRLSCIRHARGGARGGQQSDASLGFGLISAHVPGMRIPCSRNLTNRPRPDPRPGFCQLASLPTCKYSLNH